MMENYSYFSEEDALTRLATLELNVTSKVQVKSKNQSNRKRFRLPPTLRKRVLSFATAATVVATVTAFGLQSTTILNEKDFFIQHSNSARFIASENTHNKDVHKKDIPTTEEDLQSLVSQNPKFLALISLKQLVKPTLLTYAAEFLGKVPLSDLVFRALKTLCYHEKAYVREGAVYGLGMHINHQKVRKFMTIISHTDKDPAVQEAAKDMLKSQPCA